MSAAGYVWVCGGICASRLTPASGIWAWTGVRREG
jgi:hypothetical protein